MADSIKRNDWVKIEYGEFRGWYGKVIGRKKNGRYTAIIYKDLLEPASGHGRLVELEKAAIKVMEPYIMSQKELRQFARAELTYQDIAEKVYPQFNLVTARKYTLKIEDIKQALHNINKDPAPLSVFKQWFWAILNIFYDSLNIKKRYDEALFTDFPRDEREIFSTVFSLTESLYWKLEERFGTMEDNERMMIRFDDEPVWDKPGASDDEIELSAYYAVCADITGRVDSYLYNSGKPEGQWIYSSSQMKHVISSYGSDDELKEAGPEALALYREFVRRLYMSGDVQALRILAFDHLEGSIAYRKNYELAKMYLKELFGKTGDPYAANALGYIYYYGKDNNSIPKYDEAFKYYSFGALEGIDESVYMSAEMLIYGRGTVKNIDMGINILIDGYKAALEDFCHGDTEGRFAEYAMYLGDCAYNRFIFGMGNKDAYRFYLEAEYAMKKRGTDGSFRDKKTLALIEAKLAQIRKEAGLDLQRTELKADFPLYINHMFEYRLPVKVTITQKNKDTFVLKLRQVSFKDILSGFKLNLEEPEGLRDEYASVTGKILVTYPELSYTELVTELEYTLENAALLKKPLRADGFLCDGFRRDENTNVIEFFAGSEVAAAIEAEKFVINIRKKRKKKPPERQ